MKTKVKLKDKQIKHIVSTLVGKFYDSDQKKERKMIKKLIKKLEK